MGRMCLIICTLLFISPAAISCTTTGKTGHIRVGEVRNHGSMRVLLVEASGDLREGTAVIKVKADSYDKTIQLTPRRVITETICGETITFAVTFMSRGEWADINVGVF